MPMTESELLNIIKRNLRPEVRKDLLYVQSFSVEHLRSLCRQRESFYRDLRSRPKDQAPLMTRRVCAVETGETETEAHEVIEALGPVKK